MNHQPNFFAANMYIVDIVFLLLAIVFVVIGIRRGLIGEIVRVVALLAGCIVSFVYYRQATKLLLFLPLPSSARTTISFILIYIAVALVVMLIGWIIQKIVRIILLGWLDRLLGGATGLLKVVIIAWALLFVVSMYATTAFLRVLERSTTCRVLLHIQPPVKLASKMLPPSLRELLETKPTSPQKKRK